MRQFFDSLDFKYIFTELQIDIFIITAFTGGLLIGLIINLK